MAPLVVDPCGYLNPTTRWDTASAIANDAIDQA